MQGSSAEKNISVHDYTNSISCDLQIISNIPICLPVENPVSAVMVWL